MRDKTVPKLAKRDFGHILLNAVCWMASRGWDTNKMAETLGVDPRALAVWLTSETEIKARLEDSRREVVSAIENTLVRVALGYRTEETKVFYNAVSGEVVEHTLVKQYPPDVKAAMFLLKNLDPKNWRDKPELEEPISGKPTVNSVAEAIAILKNDPARITAGPAID